MKDNEIAILNLQGSDGEIDQSTGKPEVAPVFNQKYSVETGGDSLDMTVSEDGATATVTPKNIAAGAAPVAFRVKGSCTSDAEGQNALPDAFYDDVISNPPAGSVTFNAVIQPQVADAAKQ